ncbi:MAG: DUF4349 domain-containing protein [Lachnospiraceae bacterium]|nr:DUF4349 domain-containing protein [Lachnospiraceae bacterium]
MNMEKRKWIRIVAAAGVSAVMLSACGSGESHSAATTMKYESAVDTAADYDSGGNGYSAGAIAEFSETATQEGAEAGYDDAAAEESGTQLQQGALAGRKLIKNVNLNVETEQFDVLLPNLQKRVTALGGYIEDMSSYSRNDNYSADFQGTKYLRYASMTVRMPKENLDAFLEEVGEQTNVVSRSESVTDVTLQYVDLESHKKALTTEQDRLLELMEQAQTVEDIIAIEGRLSEVRYQIESMESQLRTYDNKIDYSTVYLSIDEVERYTPTEEVTTGQRIRTGFMDSLKGVGKGLSNFGIWFVIKLPYLILWAVILLLLFLIGRFVFKVMDRRSAKKAAGRRNPYQVQPYSQMQSTGSNQGGGQKPAGQTGNVQEAQNEPGQGGSAGEVQNGTSQGGSAGEA